MPPLDPGCSVPFKGNPQQANYKINEPSRAVTQPSPAMSFREQLNLFPTAIAFHCASAMRDIN
jgi:hypothetical protein